MDEQWINNPDKRKTYYERTKDRQPHSLLLKVLDSYDFATALELGCGAGVDAKEIAGRGIKVTALDVNPEVKEFLGGVENVDVVISKFQDFDFKKYDLIYSRAALPFMPREHYFEVLGKISSALNPGGVFVARVWGDKDSGNRPENKDRWTFASSGEIKQALGDLEIVEFSESEEDGETALGMSKHWHKIDIVAKKSSQ